jgi:hypothetical protein
MQTYTRPDLSVLVRSILNVFKRTDGVALDEMCKDLMTVEDYDAETIKKGLVLAKAGAIPGLEGAVRQIPAMLDNWNNGTGGRGGSVDGSNPTGNVLPSSGREGPDAARHYSPDAADQAGFMAQMYSQFAEAMDRVSAVEKAVVSLSALLAAAFGKADAFPSSETRFASKSESDEPEDEDERKKDEADLTAKGELRIRQIVGGVPALFEQLMKTSRGPSLPPQLYKAHVPTPVDSDVDTIEAATLRMRARAKQAGMPVAEHLLKSGSANTPFNATDIGNTIQVMKNNGVWGQR